MDIKQLLEKMDQFAGQVVGQKPGDQWKGTDKAPPGKKLVGDSILKDLSKGKKAKNKEQELSEEFQAFLEAEFQDTVDKRPARKNARHSRGHEPQPRYKTVKADESAMSEKDIELQDYRSMSHKEFQTAYGMTKTEWISKNKSLVITNPNIKKGLGLDEGAEEDPIVAKVVKQMRPGLTGLDMGNEAFLYFAYELGKQRARDAWSDYLPAIRAEYEKGLNEDANTDNKLAKLLTRFINQNEGAGHAVASDAIEYIKKMGHIEQFATSLDYFGVDLDEGWESGPEEYEEPYDDADDAYDAKRQEKIDTEAEKEWAKLPKVSTYKLIGRGPNMEPNYELGDEFDTLEQALEYRAEIMKDPKTPHPEHIGIRTLTRVVDKEQTNETIYTAPRNREEYDAKMQALQDLQTDRNNVGHKDLQDRIAIYLANLEKLAVQKGWKQPQPTEESRGHKILATKLKNLERERKFASGELKVPTPQERQAQLKQLEKAKSVKEFVAPPQGTATQTMQQKTQAQDPKQAQAVAQATQAMKSATGSSASPDTLAKALDTASQGKPVAGQEAAALEPLMKDMATVAQDPKLAGSFKSLVSQINQAQIKQQQTT
jgi:hypothetical protein